MSLFLFVVVAVLVLRLATQLSPGQVKLSTLASSRQKTLLGSQPQNETKATLQPPSHSMSSFKIENVLYQHLLLYKTLLRHIWIYGIVLWWSAKPSNTRTVQAFQAIRLCTVTSALWYGTDISPHHDWKTFAVNQIAPFQDGPHKTLGFIRKICRATLSDSSNSNGQENVTRYDSVLLHSKNSWQGKRIFTERGGGRQREPAYSTYSFGIFFFGFYGFVYR